METALREANEEIGLAAEQVDVLGALPPIGTFVTSYKVHPFVGVIPADLRFEPWGVRCTLRLPPSPIGSPARKARGHLS